MTTSTWYSVTDTESPDPAETSARDRVAAAWADAPMENLETLSMLLEVAQEQVIGYAPAPVDPQDWGVAPLTRFVYAQLRQTVNLWNAGRVSSGGEVGIESFSFTPRPLDKTIRTIIRPVDGKPDVY